MPDDVILTPILCPIYIVLVVMEHREVIGALGVLVDALVRYTLGSAGTRQQWLVAKWLGISVTVRVRIREGFISFFFFLCRCDGHHLLSLAWIASSMSDASIT